MSSDSERDSSYKEIRKKKQSRPEETGRAVNLQASVDLLPTTGSCKGQQMEETSQRQWMIPVMYDKCNSRKKGRSGKKPEKSNPQVDGRCNCCCNCCCCCCCACRMPPPPCCCCCCGWEDDGFEQPVEKFRQSGQKQRREKTEDNKNRFSEYDKNFNAKYSGKKDAALSTQYLNRANEKFDIAIDESGGRKVDRKTGKKLTSSAINNEKNNAAEFRMLKDRELTSQRVNKAGESFKFAIETEKQSKKSQSQDLSSKNQRILEKRKNLDVGFDLMRDTDLASMRVNMANEGFASAVKRDKRSNKEISKKGGILKSGSTSAEDERVLESSGKYLGNAFEKSEKKLKDLRAKDFEVEMAAFRDGELASVRVNRATEDFKSAVDNNGQNRKFKHGREKSGFKSRSKRGKEEASPGSLSKQNKFSTKDERVKPTQKFQIEAPSEDLSEDS